MPFLFWLTPLPDGGVRAESFGPGNRLLHPGLSTLHAGQGHLGHSGDTGVRGWCGETSGAEGQGEGADGAQHGPSDLFQQRSRRGQWRPPENGKKNPAGSRHYVHMQFIKLLSLNVCVCVSSCTQAPEERQRLVKLVQEEPLPADAPPLPDENQSDDTAGDTDGGEKWFGPI